MPFRIHTDHHLADEIRRIARKRIRSAIRAMGTVSETPDEAVHQARKDLKKLRALIRLVRGELGESHFKKENRRFRNVARGLSGFRDASVRVALVESLRQGLGEGVATDALRMAGEKVRGMSEEIHAKGGLQEVAKEVTKDLKKAKAHLGKWPLEDADGFASFREGLLDSYGRGRVDFARCLIHPTFGNFHEWRKQCKYLRYQLGFLRHAAPEKIKRLRDSLNLLGERLGDDHDQAVLSETLAPLAAKGVPIEELAAIHADLEKRHRKLMDRSLSMGRTFFAAEPEAFVAKIEGWWKHAVERATAGSPGAAKTPAAGGDGPAGDSN